MERSKTINTISKTGLVERKSRVTEVTATPVVTKILKGIKNTREDMKNLKYDEDQFKKDLDAEINGAEVILDEKGHVIATWLYNDTPRFDMETFKEEHPQMYEDYLKTSRERRLTLKK